jgi:hypothetical protein
LIQSTKMLPSITINLLKCSHEGYLKNIIQQLIKDFEQAGFTLSIVESMTAEEVAFAVVNQIELILMDSGTDIRSLLYRIDVREKEIKALHQFSAEDVALLLLNRIIEKVQFKIKFSNP